MLIVYGCSLKVFIYIPLKFNDMGIFDTMKKTSEKIIEAEKKKEPERKKLVDGVIKDEFGDSKNKTKKK